MRVIFNPKFSFCRVIEMQIDSSSHSWWSHCILSAFNAAWCKNTTRNESGQQKNSGVQLPWACCHILHMYLFAFWAQNVKGILLVCCEIRVLFTVLSFQENTYTEHIEFCVW